MNVFMGNSRTFMNRRNTKLEYGIHIIRLHPRLKYLMIATSNRIHLPTQMEYKAINTTCIERYPQILTD